MATGQRRPTSRHLTHIGAERSPARMTSSRWRNCALTHGQTGSESAGVADALCMQVHPKLEKQAIEILEHAALTSPGRTFWKRLAATATAMALCLRLALPCPQSVGSNVEFRSRTRCTHYADDSAIRLFLRWLLIATVEVRLGDFSSAGPVSCWGCAPTLDCLFLVATCRSSGIGFATREWIPRALAPPRMSAQPCRQTSGLPSRRVVSASRVCIRSEADNHSSAPRAGAWFQ